MKIASFIHEGRALYGLVEGDRFSACSCEAFSHRATQFACAADHDRYFAFQIKDRMKVFRGVHESSLAKMQRPINGLPRH